MSPSPFSYILTSFNYSLLVWCIHPDLRNITLLYVTPSLISQNCRERMLLVWCPSLLSHFPPILHMNWHQNNTTRETVTNSTEIQHKTIKGFCCFGRVVGVILLHEFVVWNLLDRSCLKVFSSWFGQNNFKN